MIRIKRLIDLAFMSAREAARIARGRNPVSMDGLRESADLATRLVVLFATRSCEERPDPAGSLRLAARWREQAGLEELEDAPIPPDADVQAMSPVWAAGEERALRVRSHGGV